MKVAMETKRTALYERFREHLDYDHLENLRAILVRLLDQKGLQQGKVVSVRVGPPLDAVIIVLLHGDVLWLLAGHWSRPGEPNKVLLQQVERYRCQILGIDNR